MRHLIQHDSVRFSEAKAFLERKPSVWPMRLTQAAMAIGLGVTICCGGALAEDAAKGSADHIKAVTSAVDAASIQANTATSKDWPTVGLDYVHLTVDRYAESGSIAPMIIEGQTNDSLRSSLGGTVAYATKVCGLALSPYLQAGWDHEFLDAVQAVNSRLASGAGSDFTVYGASSGHEIATFGLGVNAALTERISANLGYAGEANESFQDHSLRASLRVTF